MNSPHISHYEVPADCTLDPYIFVPGLFHGETAQGLWTVTYVSKTTQTHSHWERAFMPLSLKKLLYVHDISVGDDAHNILAMKTLYSYPSLSIRTQFSTSSMWLSRVSTQENVIPGMQ